MRDDPDGTAPGAPAMRASEGPAAVAPPLVSVIVRTKDRPALLQHALATLAAQSYAPIEAVVVNDGGCDLDVEGLRSMLGRVALAYVRLPERRGRAHAANTGIAAAHGPLIAFLDDDDELLPAHVATLAGAQAVSGADVVYSDCELVEREFGPEGEILREVSDGRFFMSRDFSAAELCFENFIPLLCVMMRREVVGATGGFDEQFELYEDWDFFVRAAQHARFLHVPEVTARYVQWSRESQIAFSGGIVGRQAYERVLAKHLERVTPAALHDFLGVLHEERQRLHRRIATLERGEPALAATLHELERARAGHRELELELADRQCEVADCRAEIARRGLEIERRERALERVRAETDSEVARLRSQLGEVTRGLRSSLAWRAIERFRVWKERVLPAGSRRRRFYDRLLGTGDYRLRAGGAVGKEMPAAVPSRAVRETFLPPAIATAGAEALTAKVSVVIPTLNAGTEFRAVLERLRAQRELPDLEIVAVDSGSTDGTLALCERHRVKVLRYPDQPFNHGLARNVGAAAATGDFLVFMSQDAIPVGERAVAAMVRALQADPLLAAASARQLPRSDADLFTCWQLWCYRETVLGYAADTLVNVDPGRLTSLPPTERRRAAQIDNVFACVRQDAFDRLRFRELAIAEDLDLGLRLLDLGYRTAFLSSVAVVHSHDRPPAYHLRRSFAEWRTLADLLGHETLEWRGYGARSIAEAVAMAVRMYHRVGVALTAQRDTASVEAAEILVEFRGLIENPRPGLQPTTEPSLEAVLQELRAAFDLTTVPVGDGTVQPMLRFYSGLLASFLEYLRRGQDWVGADGALGGAFFKICAETIGHCLADLSVEAERRKRHSAGLDTLGTVLSKGI